LDKDFLIVDDETLLLWEHIAKRTDCFYIHHQPLHLNEELTKNKVTVMYLNATEPLKTHRYFQIQKPRKQPCVPVVIIWIIPWTKQQFIKTFQSYCFVNYVKIEKRFPQMIIQKSKFDFKINSLLRKEKNGKNDI